MSPRSLGSSALLHGLLVLLVVFGLPLLPQEDILYQPQVISVDLKIAPVANAPTRRPTPPKKPAPAPPKPKPAPPKPEPVKEKPKPPEPKPAPKPEPKKEKPKPKEPEKPKKKEEPKEKEPTLDDILNSLEKETPKEEKVEETPAEKGADITSDVPYDASQEMSQTVKDSIRNQIMECWNYQGGAKDQGSLTVTIRIKFRVDGSVENMFLDPSDAARRTTDASFASLVYSAESAIRRCAPLKGLPKDGYSSWKEFELVFDPDDWL